ncbi:cobyrinic acid a,c-diamide synthase [Pseudomonas agarici]|uniref:Cobyrinic acid a,c-diamide synthase n=1 Tax=Pseudomonas agarici TaxID=46677 RepID=A0A0X1T8Z9_PSEAA|nr:MinD/ParA family protein [Pseudomonas agarici]AMB88269.1 cobyrinic acid a,c-diamide synthase [Pseudomonas agarici]
MTEESCFGTQPIQVIAITSGKGGVGRTSISVNLALALANSGKRVVLFDADFGLANIHVQLGFDPKLTIVDMIKGNCELRDLLHPGPMGIKVVPASSGLDDRVEFNSALYAGLIQSFSGIENSLDVLIIDTAAGISESVISMVRAAQEVLVVLTSDPASLSDAYALISLLHRSYGLSRFRVLANMMRNVYEGLRLFKRLTALTDKYLDVSLQFAGSIPYDDAMHKVVQQQRGIYEALPRSEFSKAMDSLALKFNRWTLQAGPRGHQEFFVEKLIRMQTRNAIF